MVRGPLRRDGVWEPSGSILHPRGQLSVSGSYWGAWARWREEVQASGQREVGRLFAGSSWTQKEETWSTATRGERGFFRGGRHPC